VVDLTHALHPGIPFWPGRGYRPFSYEVINELDRDAVAAGWFGTPEHMGTHLDAPSHFERSHITADRVPATSLVCQGVLLDITPRATLDASALLDVEDVDGWRERFGEFPPRCVALVRSGWSARWTDVRAFRNVAPDGRLVFPAVAESAARLLADHPAVVGLGVDTLSADNGLADGSPCHHRMHAAGKFILENLANLDQLPPRDFVLFIGSLPIRGGTGAPARVIALLPGPAPTTEATD
jgi:kynurenine formamidase